MKFIEKLQSVLPPELSFDYLLTLVPDHQWQNDPLQATLIALITENLFDADDYLKRYPDVEKSGVDPIWHFLKMGIWENRTFNLLGGRSVTQWENSQKEEDLRPLRRFDPDRDDSISVLIPAYNAEAYLERAVESVLNQTHENLEIIIFDDVSTDNTWNVACEIHKHHPEIQLYQGRINEGESYGRNFCLARARGRYTTFIDADDFYSDQAFLATLLKNMQDNAADIGITPARRKRQGQRWTTDQIESGIFTGAAAAQKYLDRKFGTHACWAKMYNTNIAKSVHVNEFGYSEDVPFVAECLEKAKTVFVDSIGGYVYDLDTVSSLRPSSPQPLHFYSSLRVLPEIILLAWRVGLNARPFIELWQKEHGLRIREYLVIQENVAPAMAILSAFGWFTALFEQVLPELAFWRPLFTSAPERMDLYLPVKYHDYIVSLLQGLEAQIATRLRPVREINAIWAQHLANGGLERVASQLGCSISEDSDVVWLLDHKDRIDFPVQGKIMEADLLNPDVLAVLHHASHIFDFHWKDGQSYPFCDYALSRYPFKYIPTVHSTQQCDAYYGAIHIRLVNLATSADKFPAILCVTNAVKLAFEKRYGLYPNLRVLHNPIETKLCAAAVPIRRKLPYILFIGRLNASEPKGIDLLIQAWAQSKGPAKGVTLVLAGSGKLSSQISEMIDSAGCVQSIEVIGFRPDIYSWMKGALFIIMPSRWEGSGNVAAESLACGTPVLASAVGIAPEIIIPGINGLLIEPNSLSALKNGIDRMLAISKTLIGANCANAVRDLDISQYARRLRQQIGTPINKSPSNQ